MSDLPEDSSDSVLPPPDAPVSVTRIVCQKCSACLDAGDNFCRCCGGLTVVGAANVKTGRLPPSSPVIYARPPSWIESRVVVLLGLFVILGPLALPMLWHSRRFTLGWKIGLTIAVSLLTIAAVWYSVAVLLKAFEPLQDLRRSGLL
jgi:hypothetical protein